MNHALKLEALSAVDMVLTCSCNLATIVFYCFLLLQNVASFSTVHQLSPLRSQLATPKEQRRRRRSLYTKKTNLTEWVIENLEEDGNSITSSDPIKAGEGDTIPADGLAIGKIRVFASAAVAAAVDEGGDDAGDDEESLIPIRILVGRNGWGTGIHPTTRLCIEWVCNEVRDGDALLDYGCGSGILSIAALHMGASKTIGVDVEAEALISAERNVALNGFEDGRFQGMHTREVLPFEIYPPGGVDVCVANILIGQLVRPSMVAAIVTNLSSGGLLCLSGIRPGEVNALKAAYSETINWIDDQYEELSASETEGSIESYGFDCGRWARLVGRKRVGDNQSYVERMSDLAVS